MRLAATIIVLACALGAVGMWVFHAIDSEIPTEVKVYAALGVLVVWIAGSWLRNRRHRRLMDLRGSALW